MHTLYFAKSERMEQPNETTTQLLVYLKSLTHILPRANYYTLTLTTSIEAQEMRQETRYLWSSILMLDRHRFLSCVMSSVGPISFILLLMTAFQLVFGRPLPLLQCKILIASSLLTGVFTLLLLACPNHLSLVSFIFSSKGVTPTRSLITTFLILSSLV